MACALHGRDSAPGPRFEEKLKIRRFWSSALLVAIVLMAGVTVPLEKLSADGGALGADPVPTPLYRLPWTGGERYPVTQDYNKHFDFRLPVGTQVRAARGGTVYVKRASEDGGCCDPGCSIYDNYVRITHDDGSYGFYQHLKYGGITVNTGDTVSEGDCLGLSGATGYVCGLTGAHLHFNVNTNPFNSGGSPYGVAFTEVAFVEGAIPTVGAYTPYSQNSTSPCRSIPAPTATPTPTGGAVATATSTPQLTPTPSGTRVRVYLPVAIRDGS
jgi:murein DD-endopeptidase MepM/ murein hydrolase activator NlpD